MSLVPGLTAAAISITALIGWAAGEMQLTGFAANFIPMAPSTAICILLLAAAAFYTNSQSAPKRSATVPLLLAITVTFISTVLLFQLFLNLAADLTYDIEKWIVEGSYSDQGWKSGRMSPMTAFIFLLICSALILMRSEPALEPQSRRNLPALIPALTAFFLAGIIVVGYWYKSPLLYGGTMTPVSLPAAIGFFLLCADILFIGRYALLKRWLENKTIYGQFTRLILPGVIGINLVVGWIHISVLSGLSQDFYVITISLSALLNAGIIAALTAAIARQVQNTVSRAAEALRESEEHLFRSRERFQTMFMEAPLGIAMIDSLSGEIFEVNPRFAEIAGRTVDELLIINWMSITHPDDIQEDLDKMALLNAGKIDGFNMKKRHIRPNGEHVWINMSIAPLKVKDGSKPRHLCMIEDITYKIKADREREYLLTELERKNQDLESIVYVASHDLRSPLVNIHGFSGNLKRYFEEVRDRMDSSGSIEALRDSLRPLLDDKITGAIRYIENGAAKMDSLIEGLLQISRAGRLSIEMTKIDMEQLIQEVLNVMQFEINKTGTRVMVVKPLASCRGDYNQLNQVFSNLIDNAVKYRSKNVPPVITVDSNIIGSNVVYSIADNGSGIAPADQNKIWELFRRVGNDTFITGEGIGLSIARRIVERLGGRIWVESEIGSGSRFFVQLPRRAE